MEPADLVAQVRENLAHLGVDALDAVNLRLRAEGTGRESVAEPFGALAELQKEGLIRHLGLSEASDTQLTEAQAIAPVVTVQNLYNVANRRDDAMVDRCAAEGIAYAAYFPLGGFTPLQSATLDRVAARLGASPHAGRAGLAAAALAHDGPHPRHLVAGPPPREHRGGRPGPAARGGRRTRRHRPLTRPRLAESPGGPRQHP